MEKIDRLVWADGFAFNCHGARLGIRVSETAVLRQLPAHLPPGWKRVSSPVVDSLYSFVVGGEIPNSRVKRFHLLYAGSGRLARSLKIEDVFEALETDLDYRVAVGSRDRLFVHAGVVGWHGQAIVAPGHSMCGKTALVAALVRAGAMYYSDEFAVFDLHGRVHPYSKPLNIRGTAGERRQRLPVEVLGGRAGTTPLPVGLVVLTEYRQRARWRPQVLSPGEGVLALLGHTVVARLRPQMALETLRQVSGAMMLKGRRGDAERMAEALLRRLEANTLESSADVPVRVAPVAGCMRARGSQ